MLYYHVKIIRNRIMTAAHYFINTHMHFLLARNEATKHQHPCTLTSLRMNATFECGFVRIMRLGL